MQIFMNRIKNRSVVYKYTVFLLAAMLFIAATFTGVTVYFNASQLRSAKLGRLEGSVQRAVDDLDNQFEILQSIATAIEISNYYRPLNLQQKAYNDIVLLEDFISFCNWSPLCSHYFMFYHDSKKLYQYNGKVCYWKYMASEMKLNNEDEIYCRLNEAEESFCITQGNQLWIVFPLRFRSSSTGLNTATIVFMIDSSRLQERITQIAGEFPEIYQILWKENEMYSSMTQEQKEMLVTLEPEVPQTLGDKMIFFTSESGSFRINTFIHDSMLEDLQEIMTSKIYISIAICVLLCIGLAIALAQISLSPVRRLVMKYGNNEYWKENEFELLDNILVSMNDNQKLTVRELRKQFLAFALRGYYEPRQNDRWAAFNLSFDKPLFCVCVIDTKECSRERMEKIADSAEGSAPDHVTFYAAANIEDGIVEVIINYIGEEELKPALDQLNRAMLLHEVNVFAGSGCDNQQFLPLSYMQALTAMQKDRRISVQNGMDVKQFAMQLVEAAKTKNSTLLRNLCQQFGQQMKSEQCSMLLLKHTGYELTSELIHLCGNDTKFDEVRLSEILLLQDFDVLLSELVKLLWNAYPAVEIRESTRNDILSRTIVDYVEENINDCDFGLDKLSQRFGFSADYISGIIKKSTGKPFKEYLTMRRLELAKELILSHPEMTVNDISFAVGYRKSSNFIKKFKDVFGCTPVQYRG